ncbi:MAG: protein kinase [Ruminococcus sp.]|nr:protein kinase [Ruminococcus sp.]
MSETMLFYSSHRCEDLRDTVDINNYEKVFNWDEDEFFLDRCVAELICRTYLDKGNFFDVTTRTLRITPAKLKKRLDELDFDSIQPDFTNIFNNIKTFISQQCCKVTINIEKGEKLTAQLLKEIASDEAKRLEFVKRLFEILDVIHRNNLVHRDIKIDNLLYAKRNNRKTLVLNDWDASFLFENELTDGTLTALPMATLRYASPEQIAGDRIGLHTGDRIGLHTDIWQAGMVAYYIYNNCKFPDLYDDIDFEIDSDNTRKKMFKSLEIRKKMLKIFEKLRRDRSSFSEPQNGSEKITDIILRALSVEPNDRPTANEILEELKKINVDNSTRQNTEQEKEKRKRQHRKEIEERNRRERLRKMIALSALTLVIVVGGFVLGPDLLNKKTKNKETDKPYNQPATASPITQEITNYPVQTAQVNETDNIIFEDPENLDYTPHLRVENYRFPNGYYTGGMDEEGQCHGKDCRYEQDNGSVYNGDYYHGAKHGQGTYKDKESEYIGKWVNNVKCDVEGVIKYSNGNIYVGGVENDKRNGEGQLTVKAAEPEYQGIYTGHFVDDQFEGNATFEYDDGRIFKGEYWQDEQWNGTMFDKNGNIIKVIKNAEPQEYGE